MSDLGQLNRMVQISSASNDFVTYAKAMLNSRFKSSDALSAAPDCSPRLKSILKTAVAGGSTSDSSALAPYREISTGFAASLSPWSSYDKIYNDGAFMKVPLRSGIAIASSAAQGSAISELAPKPISEMSFTHAHLEPTKTLSFLVISNELAKMASPAAVSMIGNELRRAVALATDAKFLAVLAASAGVTSNAASGIFSNDLFIALQAVKLGANSKPYLIVSPDVAKEVSVVRSAIGNFLFPSMTINGGTIQGLKVVTSDAAGNVATLVDAAQVASEADLITLQEATHASLQLDDNPTSGATQLVSLWQNNQTGLRAERWFGVELLRSSACALITGLGEVTA
jgi:HK97 family phage major capsid protein